MGTKTYLGDAVYADWENGMVKLTTENGIYTSATIYLEPEVLENLWAWANLPQKNDWAES
jgi:hypothetical protein